MFIDQNQAFKFEIFELKTENSAWNSSQNDSKFFAAYGLFFLLPLYLRLFGPPGLILAKSRAFLGEDKLYFRVDRIRYISYNQGSNK